MIAKKKTNSKGEITKVKARLCATAANQRKEITTADVNGAYLEAFLKAEVFMELDPLYSWNS
jgi:hypothetical protein